MTKWLWIKALHPEDNRIFLFFLWGIIWHLDWQGEEILIYTDVKQREENCSKTKKIKIKKYNRESQVSHVRKEQSAALPAGLTVDISALVPTPCVIKVNTVMKTEPKKKKKRRNMKHPSLKELLLSFKPHNTGKVLASPWNDARLILSAHSRAKTFHAAGTAEVLPFRAASHRLAQSPATGMSCSG